MIKNKIYSAAKRAFDLLFSILFITVLSPVYILTTLIIMIVSPGNPIYKAERVGMGGRVFTCYKFRSMRVDSGKVRLTTLRDDDRIFPFGRFIRAAKIDELPQAVNILLGQMSVVGPRPEDKENADLIYTGEYRRILDVKPGLTSIASLYDFTHGEMYGSEEEYKRDFVPQKLQLELYYVDHKGALYDLKLIFLTAWRIIETLLGKKDFELPRELELKKRELAEIKK